jgi:hypothetical protein
MSLISKKEALLRIVMYNIVLLTMLVGCATVGSIDKSYQAIEYSDGINKKEAIIIAKQHILGTEYKHQYRIINPGIKDKKEYWEVAFLPKNSIVRLPWVFFTKFNDDCYLVYVKKSSGEIAWDGIWGSKTKE